MFVAVFYVCVLFFFFFFSSRRRHTRSLCDWSSDVCSSDLSARRAGRGPGEDDCVVPQPETGPHIVRLARPDVGEARSEEHTSELQSHSDLVCRLLLEKKKKIDNCDCIRPVLRVSTPSVLAA